MSKLYPLYGRGQGEFLVLPPPLALQNPPTANQSNYAIGQLAYTPQHAPTAFYLHAGNGVWDQLTLSSSAASFSSLAVSGLSTFSGGINTAPVVVTAGASPRTANGRSGQVTFSGVSIAAGATQSFVINNTSIGAVGTVILYSMVGATTGAALNIQSVTNVAGTSSTIVVENGTGATTSTANITFTYLILN